MAYLYVLSLPNCIMSSIPDWQQAQEAQFFNWKCLICGILAKSPRHLEDQFLVENKIYLDINNDEWVKCAKFFNPYHVKCIKETPLLPPKAHIHAHLWHVDNNFITAVLLSVSLTRTFWLFVLVSSMAGKKGFNPKWACKNWDAERWHHGWQGQCHAGEMLNLWNEQHMQAALIGYNKFVSFCYIRQCHLVCTHQSFSLCFSVHVSLCHFSQCRQCDASNVSISSIAKFFGIPKITFWKHVTGKVIGQGHRSGGKGQLKVLSQGTVKHSFSKVFMQYIQNVLVM